MFLEKNAVLSFSILMSLYYECLYIFSSKVQLTLMTLISDLEIYITEIYLFSIEMY